MINNETINSDKVFKDNSCKIFNSIYNVLYSNVCLNHGALIYEFYDYYTMVPLLLLICSIMFAFGATMFGDERAYLETSDTDLNTSVYTGNLLYLKINRVRTE